MPRPHLPAIALALTLATPALAAPHCIVEIHLPATAAPSAGRLLLFATPLPKGAPPADIDADEFEPNAVTTAAQEIPYLAPGATTQIDADTIAYPNGFAALKPGQYLVQALLDVNHDYAYGGRSPGDLASDTIPVTVTAGTPAIPTLDLTHAVPPADPWVLPKKFPAAWQAMVTAAHARTHFIDFQSRALTKFAGRPISLHGWVLTPPGYDPAATTTYPTVFMIHGFGTTYRNLPGRIGYIDNAMQTGKTPPMIWVFLDHSSPGGITEFVDSVNNGPWGQALTSELIPTLEKQYRMDAKPSGRFLTGHSSGGWATLWLQTRYPQFFGGTWSTSPDPTDFHDFTNVDLYAPNANMYRLADGAPVPLVRMNGKAAGFIEPAAKLEAVLGDTGGQFSSFDWVFSPRGPQGAPMPMFNRTTGAVNPAVAAYWENNYDIARRLAANWPVLKADLDGKIHVTVGGADTFYLDGPAHRLQAVLDGLHAHTQFTFIPGRGHFDLYKQGTDDFGLINEFAWQMFKTARPGSEGHKH